VDWVVFLNDSNIARLAGLFSVDDFYVPPPAIIAAELRRENRGRFDFLHLAIGFKADLYLTGRDASL
jgi:hypothetical protein